ncbi:MAG TPA: DUF2914 domain-containing protein [Burkholderiales bacterium]|nr:DUF2914 domain-containing protein [Burkholderiales bacterium]
MNKLLALCAMLALLVPALAFPAGKVIEAKLGKGVVDRKIVDESTTFAPGEKAYLWLKVEGADAETLTVTWQINGQTYPAMLNIGGNPWRTWASKTLHIAGEWTVTVTDAAGTTLNETKFVVK